MMGNHAGNTHKIHARAEVETADDRGAGQDQHRQVLETVYQGVRYRPAATQVAEAKRVMAVDQDAGIGAFSLHGDLRTNPVRQCFFNPAPEATGNYRSAKVI